MQHLAHFGSLEELSAWLLAGLMAAGWLAAGWLAAGWLGWGPQILRPCPGEGKKVDPRGQQEASYITLAERYKASRM